MICLLWRQHRGQVLWAALTFAVFSALMVGVGLSANHWLAGYHQWVKALADAGCAPPDAHSGDFHVRSVATCDALRGLYPGAIQPAFASRYNFTILVFQDGLPVTLAIIGALVGAPVVAREIEERAGTGHRSHRTGVAGALRHLVKFYRAFQANRQAATIG